jgi:beta-galactosidase/beta-glucuronidase
VQAQLFDERGKAVFRKPLQSPVVTRVGGYENPRLQADLTGEVNAPKLWSSESPNLYTWSFRC